MIAGPPIRATVSTTAAPGAVLARLGADATTNGARADADLVDAPILPRGQRQPGEVWLELDGVRIGEDVLNAWSIPSADGEIQQWSVAGAAESRGTRGPMGYETTLPAMDGRSIDLGVTIGTADYYLVRKAKSVTSSRGLGPGERVLEVPGLGLAGQYDRELATLKLPPEHRTTVGGLAVAILLAGNVPASRIAIGEIGPRLVNAVDLVDEPALETARELLRHHGWALVERDGQLQAVPRSPASGPARVTLRAADVELTASAIETSSDIPHKVLVKGSRQEIPGDALGETTTEEVTELRQVVGLKQAVFQQTNIGTLAATGLPAESAPRERLTARTTRRETARAGCLIAIETIDETLHRRSAARYRQDTDATPLSYQFPVWIYDAGAAQDDASPAFADRRQVFREVSRVLEVPQYGPTDEQTGNEVSVSGWLNPPHAVQRRVATTMTWESAGFISNQLVLGSGAGVVYAVDQYLDGPFRPALFGTSTPQLQTYAEATVTEIESDNGYIESETDSMYSRRIIDGWKARFADGTESDAEEPIDGLTGSTRRSWSDSGAGGASRQEVETDAEGELIDRTTSPEPNGKPAVPRCDRESRLRASSVPVEACVTADGGSGELPIESPWIETVAQALALAEVEMRVARARRLTVLMPIMPALREHDRVDVWMPEKGVEVVGEGWIESINHELEAGEQATRRLTEMVVRLL